MATGGCTNGLCAACHARFCTPGGVTSPGHGINVERARMTLSTETIDRIAAKRGPTPKWRGVGSGSSRKG